MKWLCVAALVVNLLLLAYAGYAFITVPESEIQRSKVEVRAAAEEMKSGGRSSSPAPSRSTPARDAEQQPPLDEMAPPSAPAEGDVMSEAPEGLEGAVGIEGRSTYNIDIEDPADDMERKQQALDDAKAKMRLNPLR